jgi:hypothetical protein
MSMFKNDFFCIIACRCFLIVQPRVRPKLSQHSKETLMNVKIKMMDHANRFQKCKNSVGLVDTESSFEECALAHQCFDDEPCPHMLALSRAEPLCEGDPKLQELRRFL